MTCPIHNEENVVIILIQTVLTSDLPSLSLEHNSPRHFYRETRNREKVSYFNHCESDMPLKNGESLEITCTDSNMHFKYYNNKFIKMLSIKLLKNHPKKEDKSR